MTGALKELYMQSGGPAKNGFPTTDPWLHANIRGVDAWMQLFEKATIFTSRLGTHGVFGDFHDTFWNANSENGCLGMPTDDLHIETRRAGGEFFPIVEQYRAQHFQNGSIDQNTGISTRGSSRFVQDPVTVHCN